MDPNIQNQTTQPVQNENPVAQPNLPQQSINEIPHSKSKFKLILLIIIILIFVGGGAYYLGVKQNKLIVQSQQQTVTPTIAQSTPTPTLDPTANWKTYSTSTYSIKYPNAWLEKTDSIASLDHIYDPNSMQSKPNNGTGTISYPTKFVNIATIISTDTPKQYADKMTTNNPAYTGVRTERRTISINNLSAETYKESGEGSMGYDIVVSNGNKILVLNIPTSYPTTDPIVTQILSTFKFTDQNQTANMTPDQIFSEASLQLGIIRSKLTYFRIFGQDKIQYSFGSGTNFAYKYMGKWQIAGGENAQGIAVCSELNNVPEQYRPPCYDAVTKQEKYMDGQRQSLNYPPSQMISYIGQ